MKSRKRIVVIGATSAIAEQCMRIWAKESPREIVLVGRNQQRIKAVASDLKVRTPDTVVVDVEVDFLNPDKIRALVDQIFASDTVDIVLIAHGSLPMQETCQNDLGFCRNALEINGVSPVFFAEAFAKHMLKHDRGRLAVISSVAGDRGRKSNYVYGAAKGLVTRYVEGLQHRFAKSRVKVILIKPGPTDTPMTAHLKQSGVKLAPVETVAIDIVRAIERGQPVVYTPKIWSLIMLVIRHLPYFLFKKLDI